MGAGVSVLEALEVTAGAIGNSVIERELLNAAKEVRAASTFATTFAEQTLPANCWPNA
jgi:type II secretory pathway component PulF